MTPEDIESLATRIADMLGKRGWLPATIRPAPPGKPQPGALPVWAGSALSLDEYGGGGLPGADSRTSYAEGVAAARGAAAGTAPAPMPGSLTDTPSSAGIVEDTQEVMVAVSGRHLHVCEGIFHQLFGPDEELEAERPISQPGQYAARHRVRVIGPEGSFDGVRIVGPIRDKTQVELAASDYRMLGIEAPTRDSGDLPGSGPVTLEGPAGAVELEEGAIVTARHLHVGPDNAQHWGLSDGDRVSISVGTDHRRCLLPGVLVRAGEKHTTELHIDTDEAFAFGVTQGDMATVTIRAGDVRKGARQTDERKGRLLITERDVNRLAELGESLGPKGPYLVTPAAQDRAKALGIWNTAC